YEHLAALEPVLAGGIREVIATYDLPATVASIGCRGSVHLRAEPVLDFRDAAAEDHRLQHLLWLYQVNGGVLVPAGDPWMFSVAHSEDDLRRAVENVERFAAAVTG
ncbi:MAG: aspartate aminotransferase family protein, partial [Actinomycetota bacterium]